MIQEVETLVDWEELLTAAPLLTSQYVDVKLDSPQQQSFPASLAEVAALGWSSNVEAAWACQDAAGGTLVDYSGFARTLTLNGAATHVLSGQRAVGLDDGLLSTAQKAFEVFGNELVLTTTDRSELASAATFDKDWTTPWSVLIQFRFLDAPTGGSFLLYGKYSAVGRGWTIYYSGGSVLALVTDSGGTHTANVAAPAGAYADGAWHWAYVRFDPISDTLKVDTDLGTGSSVSTATLVDALSAAKVALGGNDGGPAAPVQVRGVVQWADVNTTVASIQSWWKQSLATGFTFARASAFHCKIADDATGDVVASHSSGVPAYEWHTDCTTNPRKLGLACYAAATNLLPNTDVNNTTNYATGGGTRATFDADAPRGFREGTKHTKTAAGDKVLAAVANGAAVTATVHYVATVYCKWDGIGTAPELRVYRADGTTLIGTTSATDSTSKWRRLQLLFTAPATESVRIAFSGAAAASSAGGAWFAMPMINAGDVAFPWILTKGGTAATVASQAYSAMSGVNGDAVTLEAWLCYSWQTDPNQRGAATLTSGVGSLVNARSVHLTSGGAPLAAGYDGAGAPVTVPILGATITFGTEARMIGRFDKAERNAYAGRIELVGVAAVNDATDLPVGAALPVCYFGSLPGGVQANAAISKVRIWRYTENLEK